MSLRAQQCFFCAKPPAGEYVLTSDKPPSLDDRRGGTTRTRMVLPLCAAHHTVLSRAGQHGRRHSRTQVRWWLGVR
jgi:hypothetical protein